MDGKEMISYYDMGGRDAEMYRAIDEYLRLTARFSPENVVRKRKKLLTFTLVGGILLYVSIPVTLLTVGFKIPAVGLEFVIGNFLLGVWRLARLIYGVGPFTEMVRAEKIISADSLERVYNDFIHARQMGDTNIRLGEEYIFKKDDCLYRIKDIQRTYIRKENSDGSCYYFASVEILDECGLCHVDVKMLNGFSEKKMQARFEELTAPIEQARYKQNKSEDKL
ncbi:hypothetical protein [Ruminococcus sp.]|uniref:hypothetical protein n=1 Tax=Ruminococcus sp. TaxID=41978 RepID=UPI0025CD62BD|nr:hypothetical protein [Ruminococcus sp.]MBQ9542193.1 hypothetical protein [Ruminococcus sp.]